MHSHRKRHASNVLTYLSEPTVIVRTMSLDGYHTYTSLLVLLSLTMYRHRSSNCTIILPVVEGWGPLHMSMRITIVSCYSVCMHAALCS